MTTIDNITKASVLNFASDTKMRLRKHNLECEKKLTKIQDEILKNAQDILSNKTDRANKLIKNKISSLFIKRNNLLII